MVTGARRGELCALGRRPDVDLAAAVLQRPGGALAAQQDGPGEKDTKDPPEAGGRRWTPETHPGHPGRTPRAGRRPRGLEPVGVPRSLMPPSCSRRTPSQLDALRSLPDSVIAAVRRARSTGSASVTTLHKLRHYSATELIAAGVNPRTVAGRLGHGGGGTTTLRFYSAWVSESDQRAASTLRRADAGTARWT